MNPINRIAIVVHPREPFFAWARSLEADSPVDQVPFGSVYLAEAGDRVNPEAILRRHFKTIFEEQLDSWKRVRELWPAKRTFEMFQRWFDARVIEVVLDLSDGPIDDD